MDDRNSEERPSVVFWIVVVLVGLYVGVRVIQGIAWLVKQVG